MFKTGPLSLCPRSFLRINSFSKFSAASGDPYCGDIDPGLYDNARTACLTSCAGIKFTVLIQGKKIPPERGSEGVFLFFICHIFPRQVLARYVLVRVIHLEFDWMRCVFQCYDFFHLQLNKGIYLVIGEHIAFCQIGTVCI